MPVLTQNPDGSVHIHSYVRMTNSDGSKSERFQCDHPDCAHIRVRSDLVGKRSLCPLCHSNSFLLTYHQLRKKRPHCAFCGKAGEERTNSFLEKVKLIDKELGLAPID